LGKLVTHVRKWWQAAPAPVGTPVPYEVVCACGHVAVGFRRPVAQVVSCARCGAKVFILPLSPFPPIASSRAGSREIRRATRKVWLMPAAAVVATVAGLFLAYQFVVAPWIAGSDAPPAPAMPARTERAAFAFQLHAARQRLSEGSFRLARATLEQARQESGNEWRALPREQRQDWTQLQRQAAVLADLLAEPLEDVVRHASGVKEAEWDAEFRQRYQGRAVVFDVVVQRLTEGGYRHNYCLVNPHDEARLELGDLALLRRLPLDQPQRLVFGARLAGVGREAPGGWVVRLAPDSGVFLTDPGAAAACCPGFADLGTRALLEQQAAWAADESRERFAPPKN
jgi:hypothetical protein